MSSGCQSEAGASEEWIGGLHAVLQVLRERPGEVLEVWFARRSGERVGQAILDEARQAGIKVHSKSRPEMDALLPGIRHQGVAIRLAAMGYLRLDELLARDPPPRLVVILDGITDPHNLGAILRASWAFGVDGVVVAKHRSAGLTPAAVKVAAGAAGTVPVCRVVNLVQALDRLKAAGFWVYGTALDGQTVLERMDLSGRVALVLGAEGKGMRPTVRSACDQVFRIEMEEVAGSLNVSVAAGIILYRAHRMRNSP
ncbi:MAG: 23S rRNA (guanosine(2251)-2'-O)-methyltransferase RlmB [Bradymonadales bacterium]|nr:23S rRNA (guanosine(2251)-2'-O)-methyltransferase RlmB [Bradymonadales bacterium]